MTNISLERAQKNLEMWLKAEEAVATGQSYAIGSQQLTRADLSKIAERITYWDKLITKIKLKENGKGGIRLRRGIPYDS